MITKRENQKSTTSRVTHGLLAGAVAAMVTMPVAFANAGDSPVVTKSAASLQKQVKSLKKRVASLESGQTGGAATQARPIGPAGGDLTGQYPNPQIGVNAVGSVEIIDESIGLADIGPNSVGAAEIGGNAVSTEEIQELGIGPTDLGLDSVGALAVKGVISRIGQSVTVANNSVNSAVVGCLPGEQLIGGGGAYTSNVTGVAILASAPGGANGSPTTDWVVTGNNTSGSTKELVPWATCLVS